MYECICSFSEQKIDTIQRGNSEIEKIKCKFSDQCKLFVVRVLITRRKDNGHFLMGDPFHPGDKARDKRECIGVRYQYNSSHQHRGRETNN